ncbi:hypothetical protein [Helicobacter labacensis]|uniref:hypothetical protein n=1 Tax=Helicobacter labacensis TaxID=2316079 RepID=UPI0013CE32AF|nr:hypothetical protein [Helicobacter labacensis]
MPIMQNGKSDCITPADLPIGKPSTGSVIGTTIAVAAAAYGIYKACSSNEKKEESE